MQTKKQGKEKMKELVASQFDEHIKVFGDNSHLISIIEKISRVIIGAYKDGKRLYACGNGGSSCDAMHLVEEIVGQYKNRRPPLPAQHLMDPSIMTCWSNDEGFADVFRRQIEAYGKPGDIFLGISTSGNSANVLNALLEAKKQKMITIAFLGKDGGDMKGLADAELLVGSKTTARIQEFHIFAIHSILESLDKDYHGV